MHKPLIHGDIQLDLDICSKTINQYILFLLQALKVSDHYPVEVELKSIVETDETNGKQDIYTYPRLMYHNTTRPVKIAKSVFHSY